jgi:AraC-like DNA-binding protein
MKISDELYGRIINAKIFIDEHYQEPIGLADICQKAFLSPFYFHRLFTQVYKYTPHQYLTRRRLLIAEHMLNENRSVKEVCHEVGFESLSSFSVLFKKEIGYAPQYYRNLVFLKKQQQLQQPKRVIPHCFLEQISKG